MTNLKTWDTRTEHKNRVWSKHTTQLSIRLTSLCLSLLPTTPTVLQPRALLLLIRPFVLRSLAPTLKSSVVFDSEPSFSCSWQLAFAITGLHARFLKLHATASSCPCSRLWTPPLHSSHYLCDSGRLCCSFQPRFAVLRPYICVLVVLHPVPLIDPEPSTIISIFIYNYTRKALFRGANINLSMITGNFKRLCKGSCRSTTVALSGVLILLRSHSVKAIEITIYNYFWLV